MHSALRAGAPPPNKTSWLLQQTTGNKAPWSQQQQLGQSPSWVFPRKDQMRGIRRGGWPSARRGVEGWWGWKPNWGSAIALVFLEIKSLEPSAMVLLEDTQASDDHFTCFMQTYWCSMTKPPLHCPRIFSPSSWRIERWSILTFQRWQSIFDRAYVMDLSRGPPNVV